ncbi:MAG TPA: NAD-dependent epimerase/dehydratase family protein [Ktedonobacteraceae bacterium]|nr:NAD-dependent epimerase/dehydratase family protein [Ktedonobacteraceae bacterium]
MKLLIIGGTGFLGRHLTESALARGHELTLFNRGEHNPQLFPQVEKLHGDRDGDLAILQGRRWDAVIDTCGYVRRVVRASAGALANAVERYIFISTISVYADFSQLGIDEHSPVATVQDEDMEDRAPEYYGALKALCERTVEQVMPDRTLIIRPGLIVGPHDLTDRFTYWPYRVAQGGEMLAPGQPDQQTQFIDARDLAAWTIRMAEARATGLYNATGPDYPLTMGQFLEQCKAITGSNARFTWVPDKFLLDREIYLPLWVPDEHAGARAVNCSQAIRAGLTFRPLAETIRDTLSWKNGSDLRTALKPEQEQELLREWQENIA